MKKTIWKSILCAMLVTLTACILCIGAFAAKYTCIKSGCNREAAKGSAYCWVHKPTKSNSSVSGSGSRPSSSSSSTKHKYTCIKDGCTREADKDSAYCWVHRPSKSSTKSSTSYSSKSSYSSSYSSSKKSYKTYDSYDDGYDAIYDDDDYDEDRYDTGLKFHFGSKPFEVGQKVKLVKEPDNEYDSEAIKAELPGLGCAGYVANSPHTVLGDCISAGRLYDKIGDSATAKVVYVLDNAVVCKVKIAEKEKMCSQCIE